MNISDKYEFDLLHNEMENLVIDEIGRQLDLEENRKMCTCQDCILDIAALALNHLRPSYRSSVSFKGMLYKQKLHDDRHEESINKIVSEAIQKIKSSPSH